ncbi:unnamed protein product [Ciceribacter sp. T2.26MG-112.2]|uniref:Uncharacterized protein n=1 Tax=Ciceribacter selenitireducens ATCC BAA-1503 TaxID=1336235 RepID=A0A376ADW5_9HYPH|nr:unnamed protein product [Ciceribacter selenitireducens ATCC BAA-1503]SSC70625.1 unnamed protein product [Ciceribacter naphthalenivorans]
MSCPSSAVAGLQGLARIEPFASMGMLTHHGQDSGRLS